MAFTLICNKNIVNKVSYPVKSDVHIFINWTFYVNVASWESSYTHLQLRIFFYSNEQLVSLENFFDIVIFFTKFF